MHVCISTTYIDEHTRSHKDAYTTTHTQSHIHLREWGSGTLTQVPVRRLKKKVFFLTGGGWSTACCHRSTPECGGEHLLPFFGAQLTRMHSLLVGKYGTFECLNLFDDGSLWDTTVNDSWVQPTFESNLTNRDTLPIKKLILSLWCPHSRI
jgi:hypothetical protein